MKKTLIIKKIDYLFFYTILFFISFVILNYFIKNRFLCFLSSFALGFILYAILKIILLKKKNYNLAKKQDLENIKNLRDRLICGGPIFTLDYLKTVLNGDLRSFGVECDDSIYYIDFTKNEITLFDVNRIKCSIFDSDKNRYILANNISPEVKEFLSSIQTKIEFISISTLYFKYIKEKYPLPMLDIQQKNPTKNTFKRLVKIAFTKDKAKRYFTNGILIFLFSFLYPFKNYYLIFSLVLFIFAIMCIFEPFKTIDN